MKRIATLLLLLCLFLLLPALGAELGINLNLLPTVLGPPVDALMHGLARLAGST